MVLWLNFDETHGNLSFFQFTHAGYTLPSSNAQASQWTFFDFLENNPLPSFNTFWGANFKNSFWLNPTSTSWILRKDQKTFLICLQFTNRIRQRRWSYCTVTSAGSWRRTMPFKGDIHVKIYYLLFKGSFTKSFVLIYYFTMMIFVGTPIPRHNISSNLANEQ